jgi:MFS family permease
MRGFAVALTGLVNTLLAAALGPLVISLLTEHVFADQRLVGYSITVVVLPALLLGSGLFVLAYRAAVREVAGATAPPTLMAEIGAGRLTARE